jgi:hypothetical protein
MRRFSESTILLRGRDAYRWKFMGTLQGDAFVGTKFYIYGRPMEGGAGAVPIASSVTWAYHGEPAEGWFYLVDAMEAMATRRFWRAILPAHSAVEVAMMPLVRDGLERHLPRQRAQDFTRGLRYSSALNVVLPLLCKLAAVPPLSEPIREELNRLRELRNRVVHKGTNENSVEAKMAAELLCAAVFGFEYVRYARPLLLVT